ncbi:Serine/threonine-protein kinase sik1, partial [Friedmanniomyces endolithicus]
MGATTSQRISGDAITRARQNSHIALPESNIHSTNYWTGSAEVEMEFRQTYEVLRLLGRGASAEVYLIRHRETKEEYACKIVKKTNSSMNDARTMKTETTIMKKLQDKHLLRMHELYETEDTIWMILDYAEGGDMMHALASLPNYSER